MGTDDLDVYGGRGGTGAFISLLVAFVFPLYGGGGYGLVFRVFISFDCNFLVVIPWILRALALCWANGLRPSLDNQRIG